MNKPYTFVFFGIVGSGKGTQVELLQKYLKEKNLTQDIAYLYPGDEYRKIVNSGSNTGKIIKTTMEKGYLQPDFLTTSLFSNMLINSFDADLDNCLIVDGYPRTIEQSESFEQAMRFYNRNDIHFIYIEVGKEEATRRMKIRARSDDTDEGISKRFDEYINNVIPAMNYFKDKIGYTVHTINGEQSIEAVYADIIKSIGI